MHHLLPMIYIVHNYVHESRLGPVIGVFVHSDYGTAHRRLWKACFIADFCYGYSIMTSHEKENYYVADSKFIIELCENPQSFRQPFQFLAHFSSPWSCRSEAPSFSTRLSILRASSSRKTDIWFQDKSVEGYYPQMEASSRSTPAYALRPVRCSRPTIYNLHAPQRETSFMSPVRELFPQSGECPTLPVGTEEGQGEVQR